MRCIRWTAAAASVAFALGAAAAAHAQGWNIKPGRLGDVAGALGAQAGITITITDPDLATRPSPGVRGDLPLRAALARVLHGIDAEAIFYDQATIRIVWRRRQPRPSNRPPAAPVAPAAQEPTEIIVTASKQNMLLDHYPGSVKFMELERGWLAGNAAAGTSAIIRLTPALGSTNLGPGREKIFIRGIADSSFSGPTQATAGQYLGDVRLNYNAPDPNLNLYDMKRVEILVGPQGTLYGASSLGGVIRLIPNLPDTNRISATASANTGFTQHGGISQDGAAMLNLPVVDGRFAVRVVSFGGRAAGYIDSPARGLRNINGTTSYGGRLSLRAEDLDGWTIDLGSLLQHIVSDDGQYVLRGDPPLTRNTLIPQPFKNAYRLAYVSARRKFGSIELVTTTSLARHKLTTVFDATGYGGTTTPTRFEENNDIKLFSHETRLSGGSPRVPWVAGVTVLANLSVLSRSLGPPQAPMQITGVANSQAEAGMFGQFSLPLTRTLTAMAGERVTIARSTGALIDEPIDKSQKSSRSATRFSGTLALDWHPGGPLSAFFHYQQGYRAGGLAVAPSESGLKSQRFVADNLFMKEFGIRMGDATRDRLSARATIFVANWHNIQADLIDSSGLPYTTNIGRGIIYGIDGEISWHPSAALALSAAAFVNDSNLADPAPGFAASSGQGIKRIARTLPNIARNGAHFAMDWHKEIRPRTMLTADASLRFVGLSQLGLGPLLDIPQGSYVVADAGARIDFGRFAVSFKIDNIGNIQGNSFAYGNPFGVARRDQITPLRPRTFRLGLDVRF
ncbi:Outer membrane receptor proteins, mostly Fe transport [Sphingomonas sp. YR710]|uniref:TonB-dependent receptor n=1 Tax=Sphingomonas sp. YR710 TaxID=1882773 RepID=UPI00088620D6|nr:TonB-dependent receptor [Sphingomonas sp. YR710]SDD05691.1 Outer membrane receptor proteins, mostly Fe transport [Sphingomonas sp. YR710]